ncbi:MAG: hypothetical protein ABIP51_20130 [Bacteroidia bacterium]
MAVISVKYNEGKHKTYAAYKYKSVDFSSSKINKKFNSGNFVKDWYEMRKFLTEAKIDEPISQSSSVNHFIMDNAPFSSAYLHMINDIPTLLYWEEGKHTYQKDSYIFEEGLEFFVDENTIPTWEELKNLCKQI